MVAEDLGVVGQHRKRLAEDPEYREAALTAPSITDKTGISAKYLPRTAPTVPAARAGLSAADLGADAAGDAFDADAATKDELIDYAERNGIEIKKSDKVDDIRADVKAASA